MRELSLNFWAYLSWLVRLLLLGGKYVPERGSAQMGKEKRQDLIEVIGAICVSLHKLCLALTIVLGIGATFEQTTLIVPIICAIIFALSGLLAAYFGNKSEDARYGSWF
ncbi:hypothetical protein CMO96_04190 [Candidatus Woesebacteria bacterium]|nr:hypothetical protein [Candidatus Woesebacteria bacterium]